MSDNVSNEVAMQLEAEPAGESGTAGISSGEISFGWKLRAIAVPASPATWRVSLLLTPEGNRSQPFPSSEVEMGLGDEETVSFTLSSPPVPPDDYGVHRFETTLHNAEHGSGNAGDVIYMRFKLLSNNGSAPTHVLIENTDITIFWIIGARNISLTTTDV